MVVKVADRRPTWFRRNIVKVWLSLFSLFFILLGAFMFSSAYTGGLGLVRDHGHFQLRQGLLEGDISEDVGWCIWILERILLLTGVCVFLVAPIVYWDVGTLKLKSLLSREDGSGFAILVWSAVLFVLLGALYFASGAGRHEGFRVRSPSYSSTQESS